MTTHAVTRCFDDGVHWQFNSHTDTQASTGQDVLNSSFPRARSYHPRLITIHDGAGSVVNQN